MRAFSGEELSTSSELPAERCAGKGWRGRLNSPVRCFQVQLLPCPALSPMAFTLQRDTRKCIAIHMHACTYIFSRIGHSCSLLLSNSYSYSYYSCLSYYLLLFCSFLSDSLVWHLYYILHCTYLLTTYCPFLNFNFNFSVSFNFSFNFNFNFISYL